MTTENTEIVASYDQDSKRYHRYVIGEVQGYRMPQPYDQEEMIYPSGSSNLMTWSSSIARVG